MNSRSRLFMYSFFAAVFAVVWGVRMLIDVTTLPDPPFAWERMHPIYFWILLLAVKLALGFFIMAIMDKGGDR